jgi:hypothetical protein
MKHNPFTTNLSNWQSRLKKIGNPVSKVTQVAGKRIGGALRAENARQQKRKDTRR